MVSARFEQAVAQMMAHARLLERAVHDPGPWTAVICGCRRIRIPLERHERPDDRIVLTGYMSQQCTGISAVEIWCGGELAASWPTEQDSSPVRVTLELGIEDAELTS
jgi:hypothetical protein